MSVISFLKSEIVITVSGWYLFVVIRLLVSFWNLTVRTSTYMVDQIDFCKKKSNNNQFLIHFYSWLLMVNGIMGFPFQYLHSFAKRVTFSEFEIHDSRLQNNPISHPQVWSNSWMRIKWLSDSITVVDVRDSGFLVCGFFSFQQRRGFATSTLQSLFSWFLIVVVRIRITWI